MSAPDRTRPIYSFLPWVRQGIPGEIAGKGGRPEIADGRIGLTIRLVVNEDTAKAIDTNVRLYGPGDITGIDPREIVRTDPPHLTADFEPGYFPAIEFDRPDFPWLFTPASPAGDVLAPWLCLVVVPKGTRTTVEPASPLPILTCPRADLPDLAASSRWAHAQIAWTPPLDSDGKPVYSEGALADVIASTPEQAVSRLLSPAPLAPNQAYHACLVPTYDIGRKAGLAETITPDDERALRPAWTAGGSSSVAVRLPVYYHWEFATSSQNSFEAMVRRLRPFTDAPAAGAPRIGRVPVDIAAAGWESWEMPPLAAADAVMTFEGVLLADDGAPRVEAPAEVERRLERILARASDEGVVAPVVAPPLYGGIQAERNGFTADKPWLRQLNLDPSYRIAAGLGALVVRYQQEPLMAAAWEQAADRQRALEQRTRTALAGRVSGALVERLSLFTPEHASQVTQPMHAQVRVGESTLAQNVRESTLPAAALSASFRGLVRPQGPLARRLRENGAERPQADDVTLVKKLRTQDTGAATLFSADQVKAAVIDDLRPDPSRPADPASATPVPSFPQPMYESLRDYVPELFVPGMARVGPNSVALLKTNPRFVEAFMAGLNHEMSRELVWRDFPGDITATFFRRFWDAPAAASPADIPPIGEWTGPLGSHAAGSDAQIVVLIRADVIRRFPAAVIYAVKAVRGSDGRPALPDDDKGEVYHPRFRGTNGPDAVFLGFAVSERTALGTDGGAGVFIVIQEQPTEPRFGWDPGAPLGAPGPHGAALAHRTLRRAFRMAIHASAIVPRGGAHR